MSEIDAPADSSPNFRAVKDSSVFHPVSMSRFCFPDRTRYTKTLPSDLIGIGSLIWKMPGETSTAVSSFGAEFSVCIFYSNCSARIYHDPLKEAGLLGKESSKFEMSLASVRAS